MKNKKIVILGAGISGLATAWWLNKDGFEVTLLEANDEPGGAMITRRENGYLVDYGPNSGLDTTPLISKLAEETGIKDEMIYANEESSKRYILKKGALHPLPMGPMAFLKTPLFSASAKLRVMAEPFIGKSDDGYYQSMADFVRRRLGHEFLDYAIDPFVSGVFAGDPEKLSVKSAFPKLYRLEEVYGGLVKGMIKGAKERKKRAEKSKQNAKMFSFINGMQSFPKAIANKLGEKVLTGAKVMEVTKNGTGYNISYKRNGKNEEMKADILISAMPAHVSAEALKNIDSSLPDTFNSIYYPPVALLYLGYKKADISQPLDGFGYLIPSKEKRKFLGAIWSSVIFPERAPEDHASFTLFIGGARKPDLQKNFSDKMVDEVILEFNKIMRIDKQPEFKTVKMWDKAIPQYNLGHIEFDRYFDKLENENPGLFLTGNYRGGISVGDCVKNSDLVYQKIKEYCEK